MKFCPECGSSVNESQQFCSKCGCNLKSTESKFEREDNYNSETISKNEEGVINNKLNYKNKQFKIPNFKANKRGIIGIGALCVVLILFFIMGKSASNPSKVVVKFQKAVTSDNKSQLASVLYCNDARLKIDEKNVSPLMEYFKENPSYLNKVMQNLNDEAIKLEETKGMLILDNNSKDILSIAKVGKKFLFFPNYKVVVNPAFVQVNTGIKDVTFLLNSEEIGKSDSDNYSKEFGPFVPGKYKLLANYKGKYLSLNEPYEVDLISNSGKANVDIFKNISYVQITSDCPEAEIFVNGRATGVKIMNSKNFGPLSGNTKVYAIASKNGKRLKSNEYTVQEGDQNINLSFQEAQDRINNGQKEIQDLIYWYTYNFAEAVNTGDFLNLEYSLYPESQIYNEQKSYVKNTYNKGIRESILSFTITSCEFNADNTAGKVTTEETYRIDTKEESSVKSFKNIYTFRYNGALNRYQLDTISN